MTKPQILYRMRAIKKELAELAAKRSNLWDEYMQLKRELGGIEYAEMQKGGQP